MRELDDRAFVGTRRSRRRRGRHDLAKDRMRNTNTPARAHGGMLRDVRSTSVGGDFLPRPG